MIPVGFGASGGYSIPNSVRLNGTSDYLSLALTTSATTSGVVCVKRGKLGATQPILDNKIYFNSSDQLVAFGLTTTKVYREPESWIFLFWNATGIYDKGTLLTGTGTYTPAAITNPRLGYDGTNYFSGHLANFCFWNGSSVSYQGTSTDANGQTVAARPADAGSAYSFLEFKNSGSLGASTGGNNWTVNGSPVQTVDTPTNNFPTYNAVYPGVSGLTNGNMTCTGTARATFDAIRQNSYWEVTASTASVTAGTINDAGTASTVSVPNGSTYGFRITTAGVLDYTTNGSSWTNIATVSGQAHPYSTGGTTTINFGATTLVNSVPSTYSKLCTTNLPAVSILKPSDHFDVVLAAGASIKSSSEALYTYFLEWIKDRASANNHQLIDTARGSSAVLQSNSAGAETTYSAPSGTSVGWVWNAGSASASNTSGSITSQVSVNTIAGLSIAAWSGNGSAGASIGHGLGAAPKLVIAKRRNAAASNWRVYHIAVGSTLFLELNNTTSTQSSSTIWNNTAPSSTVFTVGNNDDVNNASGTYIAYCFAEIPGYSKFGSLTTTGTSDNAFAYCHFQPALILLKRTDSTSNWVIYDIARDTYNVMGSELYPNLSNAESTGLAGIDVTSNGFKIRTSTGIGVSGTWIFAAFARFPFGGSNVAPCPAR